jgi:hypothetical protein
MNSIYKVGDAIRYITAGYDEPRMAIVDELMPGACIAEISLPQYSTPLKVYIRNSAIIEVIQPN